MNYIIYSNGLFTINTQDTKLDSDSKMITHYKNTVEQLRRSHDWKAATDHVFADSYMISTTDSYFEPQINSITSIPGDYFYYSTELDKGGGIYKKNKTNSDDEGFVFTSSDIVPQHLHASGARLACSMKYQDGTSHIAMFVSERPDYYEFTGGDSVDEHPFIYNGNVYFDSAGIRRSDNDITRGNKGISFYDIENQTVSELFYAENTEFVLPKIDQEGNLYFIKRPAKNHTQRNTFINIITAPFWIFAAIVGFVSAFVRIFSGKQLLGKSRRDSAKESAKEIIDGCDIDIEHEEKRNIKNSEKYPGYAPRNWELIKIENISNIKTKEDAETALKNAICIHHGVIGYEIINPQTVVISNGNCVFSKQLDGKQDLIVKSRAINRNFTVINI